MSIWGHCQILAVAYFSRKSTPNIGYIKLNCLILEDDMARLKERTWYKQNAKEETNLCKSLIIKICGFRLDKKAETKRNPVKMGTSASLQGLQKQEVK